ncbi:MAG: class I SAM-dependent methyltransferase, partial [Armatimonadota bacterium]
MQSLKDAQEAERGASRVQCCACGGRSIAVFHEVDNVPVHSCLLISTREEALRFPTGSVQLGFCRDCGFISNLRFDASKLDYSAGYEETQGFSDRFNAFARRLAIDLIDRYDIRGKNVLEIGCGKGEFLALLCGLGGNTGVGIDPSYVEGRLEPEAEARIEFIRDFYSEKYAHLQGDFVCCRHTLEHIGPVRSFLQTVRRSIGDAHRTVVFFEVPDVGRVLQEAAFWDVYYEHCSYFSQGSLARLFRSCDFDVLRVSRDFDDQYLLIEARPGAPDDQALRPEDDDLDAIAAWVANFEANYARKTAQWRKIVDDATHLGLRIVLWGAGSKAVAFLTGLGIGA